MKKGGLIYLATLICVLFIFSAGTAMAEKKKGKAAKVNISAKVSFSDLLKLAKHNKKHTFIILKSGTKYSVKEIKEVSRHAVVLRGPGGKEYYDVYVPISSIEAVEVRVKN